MRGRNGRIRMCRMAYKEKKRVRKRESEKEIGRKRETRYSMFQQKKALRGKISKREYDNYDRVRFIQRLRRSFIFLVAFRTI